MTISFYTKNIPEPLQQMLYDADSSGNFQPVIDYCEPLIESTTDDGVLLCYTFALMENALAFHVDDVTETGKKCLELLKKLQHTYGGTHHLKVQIKRGLKKAIYSKNASKQILAKPIDALTTKEKANLARQLADIGGVENNAKAALLHLDLMQKNENITDEPYHYGSYILCLYKSDQTDLADKTFNEYLIWHGKLENQSYFNFIALCYEQKLCNYINDKTMIQEIWKVANLNNFVINNDFPLANAVQDDLLIAADKFGLVEIKQQMSDLIKSTRKPRLIPNEVKKLIGL
jgi:hypothetical protein